jgi:UDP-2-acetamido-3-amino-2,3-dideoxy-glucuronate N-acetyltransferase
MQVPIDPRVALIHFDTKSDDRGQLIVGELASSLPFAVERFFVVMGVPAGSMRGDHAHRECHQLLICTGGRIDVVVRQPEGTSTTIHLHSPQMGLHIPPLVWAQQHYVVEGAQLLVLASHPYSAQDYIHDPDEYVSLCTASK